MATSEEIANIFNNMQTRFNADKAGDLDATIQFDLSGDNGGLYWLKINNGTCEAGQGEADNASMTMKASADNYYALASGELNPMQAFMSGKIKIQGDMSLAMKMQSIFGM